MYRAEVNVHIPREEEEAHNGVSIDEFTTRLNIINYNNDEN